jgi:preprotein translocase subunit YajC
VIFILAADSGTQSQGGSAITLLLPLILIVGLYFLMIRPQRQKQRQQQAMQSSLEVGDEVLISGGIYGRLTEIDEEAGTVRVEIAPGTEVRMLRQGILQHFVEPAEDEYEDEEPYADDGSGPSDEGTDDRP